jgi:hypothetical protein
MGVMTDPESLVHQLGRVVRDLGEDHPLTWRVCHAVTDIPGADGASITIENSSVARVTLCTTGETAELLENLQDVLEEGPCRDAFATGRPSESRLDGEAVARWPEFIPAAEKIIGPDGALWSFPMRSAGAVIGTVSLHQRQSEPLAVSVSGAQILIDAVADLLVQDPLALAPLSAATGEGWSLPGPGAAGHRRPRGPAAHQHRRCADRSALVRVHHRLAAAGRRPQRPEPDTGPVRPLISPGRLVLPRREAFAANGCFPALDTRPPERPDHIVGG